jgi:3-dehydroquinate synthase
VELVLDACAASAFAAGVANTLRVNLGERSYRIEIGRGLAVRLRARLRADERKGRCAALLVDARVARLHGAWLRRVFGKSPVLRMPGGEASKSLAGLGRVLDFLAANRIDRSGVLWVVGGGCVGDLGGFAAASHLRGIDYVQVPTTLLAAVDSSVGGKTGINLAAGKNLAGAFWQPSGVFIDLDLLRTLPRREFAAGCAEIVKYGLLGDVALFNRLKRAPLRPDRAALAAEVRRCCAIKARIVGADERETDPLGGRMLLNLGHTFGHAIERVAGYGAYLHGEAVAVGLAAAARYSAAEGLLADKSVADIDAALAAHGLPARLRRPLPVKALMAAMAQDKKSRAGRLRLILLRGVGRAVVRDGAAPALIARTWRAVGAK